MERMTTQRPIIIPKMRSKGRITMTKDLELAGLTTSRLRGKTKLRKPRIKRSEDKADAVEKLEEVAVVTAGVPIMGRVIIIITITDLVLGDGIRNSSKKRCMKIGGSNPHP